MFSEIKNGGNGGSFAEICVFLQPYQRHTCMKRLAFIVLLATALVAAGCFNRNAGKEKEAIDNSQKLPGDKMIYGLACDGCTDSVIVFLPNEGGDPVTYNIVSAMGKKQVFGHPEVGDWVGLMLNPKDSTEALMVIDLDQLKGTWTYQVMPVIRELATKSEGQIKAELTDSMRALLFVPREYGFTLKRHHAASSVGMVYKGNSLTTETLVEYPPVPNYTGWVTWNGKLILTRDTVDYSTKKRIAKDKIRRDTMEFVFMQDDSLVLRQYGKNTSYHRQVSAMQANKKAQEAVSKQAAMDTIRK